MLWMSAAAAILLSTQTRLNVQIVFAETPDVIKANISQEWEMEPCDDGQPEMQAQLEKAFKQYPTAMLNSVLKRIYIVKELKLDGKAVGALTLTSEKSLIISPGNTPIFSDWLVPTFHHELFHLIMAQNASKFPAEKWLALNEPGFRYAYQEGGTADTNKLSLDEANIKGFITPFAAFSIQEDPAEVARVVMFKRNWELERMAVCSRVRKKCHLLMHFYQSIDRTFQIPEWWADRMDH